MLAHKPPQPTCGASGTHKRSRHYTHSGLLRGGLGARGGGAATAVHPFDMYSSIRLRRAKVGREKPTYFYLDWNTDYPLISHDLWLW